MSSIIGGVARLEEERLREIRVLLRLAGINRKEAAEYLSLTSGALSRKLRGARTLTWWEEEVLRRKAWEKTKWVYTARVLL